MISEVHTTKLRKGQRAYVHLDAGSGLWSRPIVVKEIKEDHIIARYPEGNSYMKIFFTKEKRGRLTGHPFFQPDKTVTVFSGATKEHTLDVSTHRHGVFTVYDSNEIKTDSPDLLASIMNEAYTKNLSLHKLYKKMLRDTRSDEKVEVDTPDGKKQFKKSTLAKVVLDALNHFRFEERKSEKEAGKILAFNPDTFEATIECSSIHRKKVVLDPTQAQEIWN